MKNNSIPALLSLILLFCLFGCTQKEEPFISTSGPEVIKFKALPFELDQVKLLDGPFKHARDLNINVLLDKYEPDRFLAKFRAHPGGHRVGPIFGVRIIPEMD